MKVPPKRKGNPQNLGGGGGQLKASMKVPPKRKGNPSGAAALLGCALRLNESPSEKEGKSWQNDTPSCRIARASMKVPPKRKGNLATGNHRGMEHRASMKVPPKRKGNPGISNVDPDDFSLNESPSEKEGKFQIGANTATSIDMASMKVPPKRKGNPKLYVWRCQRWLASMKVPPKRKGNVPALAMPGRFSPGLNESPSEKEGKLWARMSLRRAPTAPQ